MTENSRFTSPASSTADGSSMTMRRTSCESALAMLTICWPAALSVPTSRAGEISECPRRLSRAAAERAAARRWENPKRDFSWPR